MTDIKLALRLIRGGGRAGVARMLLMGLGLTVAITAVLLVAQIPRVISARSEVLNARAPLTATSKGQEVQFRFVVAPTSWKGQVMERLFVAARPGAPPPPGLGRAPRPGEVAISPAARDLLDDPGFAALVPGTPVATITPAGLTGPDELVAYIGATQQSLEGPSAGIGWGRPSGTFVQGSGQFKSLSLELAVLILPAALIYVLACGRLSAATRRRRYASLRLVGASKQSLQRVAFIESGTAALVGAWAGALLYSALNGPLGRSGLSGLSWYSDEVGAGAVSLVLLVMSAVLAARCAAIFSSRRAAADPVLERKAQEDKAPRWVMLIPLVLGLGLVVPWLPTAGPGGDGAGAEIVLVGGAALSCMGMLLAARWLVVTICRSLLNLRLPLGVRLGVNRLVADSSSAVRFTAGLALLIVVAAIGAGLTLSAEQNASSALRPIRAHIYGNEVDSSKRDAVQDLAGTGSSWITVASKVSFAQTPDDGSAQWAIDHMGVRMLVATCADAEPLLKTELPDCADNTLYRLRTPTSTIRLARGQPVKFRRDTEPLIVTAPRREIAVDSTDSQVAVTSQLLYSGTRPPGGWIDDSTFYFALPPGLSSLDNFSTRLAQVAPTATVNASLDLSAVAAYRVHRAGIQFGVIVGFGLGLLAALITLLDRNLERRRLVVELVTLGTPASVIRAAQFAFAVLPFVLLGGLAVPVGFLIANAVAAADTGRTTWLIEPLYAALPLALIGFVAAALSSLIVVGTHPRAEDLRRE